MKLPANSLADPDSGFPAVAVTRRAALRWFSNHARDLPWRRNRSPWRVWVAEIMLQQTRVEAVVEPYTRFLIRFPTMESVARAPLSEVLAQWSGLGYYRRARLLHAGARYVVEEHAGELPRSRSEIEKVPGVGAYTAGAILSMAYGLPEAALDANVMRVVARLGAVEDFASTAARKKLRRYAEELVACSRPGEVNEALMDLGSQVCTARTARCGACPLRSGCRSFACGTAESIAGVSPQKAPRRIELACAVVTAGERTLFLRRPESDALLAGLWDFPTVEVVEGDALDGSQRMVALLRDRLGQRLVVRDCGLRVRHDIIGRKIVAHVFAAEMPAKFESLPPGVRLLAAEEFSEVGLPALPVKILRALRRHERLRSNEARGAA